MKTNKAYNRPEMMVIDMNTDNVLQDFVGFSEEENVDGPPVYTDPDDALGKGFSAWDD